MTLIYGHLFYFHFAWAQFIILIGYLHQIVWGWRTLRLTSSMLPVYKTLSVEWKFFFFNPHNAFIPIDTRDHSSTCIFIQWAYVVCNVRTVSWASGWLLYKPVNLYSFPFSYTNSNFMSTNRFFNPCIRRKTTKNSQSFCIKKNLTISIECNKD